MSGGAGRSGPALAVLAALGFLLSTDAALLTVLIEPIKRDIALSDVEIGLVQGTAFGVAYGLSSFPMGWLIDHRNRVSLLIGGLCVWMAGLALTASAHGLALLITSRIALGVVAALLVPAALSLIADLTPAERRAGATSMFAVGQSIGGGFGILAGGVVYDWLLRSPPVGAWLGATAAWRLVFIGAAIIGLPFLLLLVRLHDPGRGARQETPDLRSSLRALVAQRRFLLPWLGGLLFVQLAMQASSVWIPPVLTRQYGLHPGTFALWLSPVLLGGGVVGSLVAGRTGDWSRRWRGDGAMLSIASATALLMAPLSLFVVAPTPTWFGAVLACYMTAGAALMTFGVIAITVLIPANIRGLALGANMFVSTMFGTAFAPLIVAWFSKALGGEAHLGNALVLMGAPALVIAAILLIMSKAGVGGKLAASGA